MAGRPRSELAADLLQRLRQGQWVALLGGPGIGKTRLATTALDGVDEVVSIGLGEAPPADLAGRTVLCDDLDRLETPMVELVVQRIAAARPRAVLLTGGRALRRLLPSLPREPRLRPMPLGVLTASEARAWVTGRVGEAQADEVLAGTGYHPYLTARVLDAWEGDRSGALERAADACASFCVSVARQVRAGTESALLDHLVLRGAPVELEAAGAAIGQHRVRAAADVLSMLGLVRWVEHDGARALYAGCGILNEWWAADRDLAP